MPNSEQHVKLVAEISASSNGLISALKQASGAINDTTGDWKSKFSQLKDSTNLISQSVKNLGDLMGKVDGADMGKITASLGEMQSVFGRVQGEVAAFAQQMAAMKNSASDLGMTVEEYQQFALAVKNAGMSMDDGEKMIRAMQERIRDFANGVPEAVAQFEKFGISLERVSSNTATSNFAEVAKAINTTIPPTERATQCMDLFKASVDRTVAVSDQFNKVISQQDKDFVSEKDVQSAISLSTAVEKLSGQIGTLAGKLDEAGTAEARVSENAKEMWSEIERNAREYKILSNEYDNYVNKLKGSIESQLLDDGVFKTITSKIRDFIAEFKDVKAKGGSFDELKEKYSDFSQFIEGFREKLDSEMEAVEAILTQRTDAGAPVDVSEYENFLKHVGEMESLLENTQDLGKLLDVPDETLDKIAAFKAHLEGLEDDIADFGQKAYELNAEFTMDEAEQTLAEYHKQFNELTHEMKKGHRVEIDLSKLDETLEKLKEVEEQGVSDERKVSRMMASVRKLRDEISAHNAEVVKGYPIWQPIVNATRAVVNGVRAIGRAFAHPIREAGRLWNWMTRIKNTTGQVNGQMNSAGAFFAKATLQIMGIGSAVAVVAKMWENVIALVKEYAEQQKAVLEDKIYRDAANNAEDQWNALNKNMDKRNKLAEKLKEFANLHDAEKTGGAEAKAKRMNLQEELKKLYGFEFNETEGAIVDLDKQIADQLEKMAEKSKKDMDSMYRKNEQVIEKTSRFIELFGEGVVGYSTRFIATQFFHDINGKGMVGEAQKRRDEAQKRNAELMERYRELTGANTAWQWRRIRQGKAQDESDKATGEILKRIHEAEGKLNDWKNSLTDTERMKNLRVIMAKYEDAVKSGAMSEEARKVAVEAIADMLGKEKEKEIELVKAIEERIKQYKEAYNAYAEAQRAVVDAQKDYARTQKELANEAKAERMARRRERLQKAMGRFGFTPFEGFSLNESSSARRERRRNAQIDASIASKMTRAQAGDRVHWTPAEKERLSEFQRLQKKDKQLEAAQKQMDAADKQQKAAEQLQEAAKAIQNANKGVGDSAKELGKAVGEMLANSLPKRSRRGSTKEASELFDNAEMTLKGMDATIGESASYGSQLDIIHKDLQQIMKHTYFVK